MKKIIPLLETTIFTEEVSAIKIKPRNYPRPNRDPFDTDLLPTGSFPTDCQTITKNDIKRGYIEPKIKSYTTKQLLRKCLLNQASDTPEFVLALLRGRDFQDTELDHYREAALKKLVRKEQDPDKKSGFADDLEKHQSRVKTNETAMQWNLNLFLHKIIEIAYQDKDICNTNFNLWENFDQCRQGMKKSFLPILRLSLIFSKLKESDIKKVVNLAMKIDPIKTYNYFLMISTIDFDTSSPEKLTHPILPFHKKFQHPALLPSLKKEFPFDWKIASFFDTESSSSKNSRSLSSTYLQKKYKAHLANGINLLITDDFDGARTELVQAKHYGIGEPSSYGYICLSWLLQGDIQKGLDLLLKETECFLLNRNPKALLDDYIAIMSENISLNKTHTPFRTTDRAQNKLLKAVLKTFRSQTKKANYFSTMIPLLNQCNDSMKKDATVIPMVFQILKWDCRPLGLSLILQKSSQN